MKWTKFRWILVLGFLIVSASVDGILGSSDSGSSDCDYHQRYFPPGGGGCLALDQGSRLCIRGGGFLEGGSLWGEACTETKDDLLITSYRFGPSGTEFDEPALLILQYGLEYDDCGEPFCYYWDPSNLTWVPQHGYHDQKHHRFIFEINHFSLYAVAANRGEGDVHALPPN